MLPSCLPLIPPRRTTILQESTSKGPSTSDRASSREAIKTAALSASQFAPEPETKQQLLEQSESECEIAAAEATSEDQMENAWQEQVCRGEGGNSGEEGGMDRYVICAVIKSGRRHHFARFALLTSLKSQPSTTSFLHFSFSNLITATADAINVLCAHTCKRTH